MWTARGEDGNFHTITAPALAEGGAEGNITEEDDADSSAEVGRFLSSGKGSNDARKNKKLDVTTSPGGTVNIEMTDSLNGSANASANGANGMVGYGSDYGSFGGVSTSFNGYDDVEGVHDQGRYVNRLL